MSLSSGTQPLPPPFISGLSGNIMQYHTSGIYIITTCSTKALKTIRTTTIKKFISKITKRVPILWDDARCDFRRLDACIVSYSKSKWNVRHVVDLDMLWNIIFNICGIGRCLMFDVLSKSCFGHRAG